MQHAYQSLGSFKVRVYQLSEGDLQHVSDAAVSASLDGPTTPFMQTALLSKMSARARSRSGLTIGGVQSNFQQMLAQGGNSGSCGTACTGGRATLTCFTATPWTSYPSKIWRRTAPCI